MKIKIFALAVLALLSFSLSAQKSFVKDAKKSFRNENYAEATKKCATAYKKIPLKNSKSREMKAEMAWMTAESNRQIENDQESAIWYQRAIDLKFYNEQPLVYFRLAEAHRSLGDYDKAKVQYEEYLTLVPNDPKALEGLKACEEAPIFIDNRSRYTVKPESKLNSNAMEMALVKGDRKGRSVVFSATRKDATGSGKDPRSGEPFFDLYVSDLDKNGNYTNLKRFEADSINTEHNEATVCFDGRYKKMFFTRCPQEKKMNLGCEIWMAEAKGKGWGLPTELKLAPNDSISVGHPCVSEDGKYLIFASDLPGGFGGKDLWYTEYDRRSDSWAAPKNLGPEINTALDELFPSFALNGDLLFASDGHSGLGGLDIFRATKQGEEYKWDEVKNYGTPINSKYNDYSLFEWGPRNGYFTSNRKTANGFPDIFSYELPPNLFSLKVVVAEVGSGTRIPNATVEVKDKATGEIFKGATLSSGEVFWDKKPNSDRYINEQSEYEIKLLPLEGYHENPNTEIVSTVGLEYNQDFVVGMSFFPKTPIRLPEVRYDLGSSRLQVNDSVNSKDSLNFVFDLLEEYNGMVIKLLSHTDSRGQASSNAKLAQARAQSCVDYLVNEKGVNASRLVPQGSGEDVPRTVYLVNGEYIVDKPAEGEYEEIVLTEKYINKYKSNKALFERLHQFNRRTEGEVVRMDWSAQ
ncbi:MAG: OmpA family protein [Lishizhenia sp.]